MIALDARMISHSGIGTYIRGLLSGFSPQQLREIVLLGDPAKLQAYPCRLVEAPEPVYGLREQVKMPRRLRGLSPDLLHVPHYNLPWAYSGRTVVTVHDLIHLLFPQFSRSRFAIIYARWMMLRVIKKAVRILADSECTRRDLLDFGARDSRIRVVPVAIEPQFRPVDPREAEPHLKKHALRPGYILFVGNLRRIKNIPRLVEAYRLLRARSPNLPPLVLAGRDQMPQITSAYRGDSSIRILGEVAADSLPALYSSASVFAFPSLYEGFGLPPLEAMACGCPVVASSGGSLPEVLGNAALLPDPLDTEAIAEALLRAMTDSNLRGILAERGRERVSRFSWKATAERTFDIYREASQS